MKRIKKLAIVGVVALVLLVVGAVFWIDRLAKTGIEVGGTYALGTPTAVDSTSIGLFSGHSQISGLQVSNPPGFNSEYFLKLGDGSVGVSLASLTGDTVEVPELTLSGIELSLEKNTGAANYKVIMDNLGRFESGRKEAPQENEGKKFVIRELVLKDITVHVNLLAALGDATKVTVPIQEVRLKDVGTASGQGVAMAQLTATILKALLEAAVQKSGGLIPADMLADLSSGLKSLESLKDVGAVLAVSAEESINQLKDKAAAAKEGIEQKAVEVKEQVGQKAAEAKQQVEQKAAETKQRLEEKAKTTADEVTGGVKDLFKKATEKPAK